MGVKSTIQLTREEAENRLVYFLLETNRHYAEITAKSLPDETLENALEELDDLAHDGESYNNYSIVTEKW